jgi:hypothetical protein
MLDNTLSHVRRNDIVIVSAEYDQFFNRVALGGEDLVRTVFDVSRRSMLKLRPIQAVHIAPLIPYYSFSKLKIREYTAERDPSEIYDRNAFNEYGDNCKHWELANQDVNALKPIDLNSYDAFVIDMLVDFENAIRQKGARLFVTFPALQEESFLNQRAGIKKVETEMRNAGLPLLGSPERYVVPDSLLFDSPYHLIKLGVDKRTMMLVDDLEKSLSAQHNFRHRAFSNHSAF